MTRKRVDQYILRVIRCPSDASCGMWNGPLFRNALRWEPEEALLQPIQLRQAMFSVEC